MKPLTGVTVLTTASAVAAMLLSVIVYAAQTPPSETATPRGGAVGQVVSLTATVEAIDAKNRTVTLKGPGGQVVDIEAGKEAKNFDQIKVGDKVQVDYYESVALFLGKPGEKPSEDTTTAVHGAEKGQTPGAVAVSTTEVTATIQAIDKAKRTVTLKNPNGVSETVAVPAEMKNFDSLKVGDSVHARFTQALAMAIKKT